MKKKNRLARGERNFQKFIIPAIKEEFPGLWQSTNGTLADMKHGIDFYYTEKQTTQSISARVCSAPYTLGIAALRFIRPHHMVSANMRISCARVRCRIYVISMANLAGRTSCT